MKGADQCPRCGSRRSAGLGAPSAGSFYSQDIRACSNCRAMWEPFDTAELLDPGNEPLGAFRQPCNNCAFRKGSPEQRDPEAFARLRAQLGWHGASFYCHKGVPVDPTDPDGFAYPRDREGKPIRRKLRLCRGYLNQLGNFPIDRATEAAEPSEPWVDSTEKAEEPR